MHELKLFLNSLSRQEQSLFAEHCGTSLNYLRKKIYSQGLMGAKICSLVELHSHGVVTRRNLRPIDWMDIWPELKNDSNVEHS